MRILANALFTVPTLQMGASRTVTEALFSAMAQRCGERGIELMILTSATNSEYWRKMCPGAGIVRLNVQTRNQFWRIAMEQLTRLIARKHKIDVFYSPTGSLPLTPKCKTVVYL